MDEVDRTWKVGELARATGLTIRALHHYDEIGLLVPGRAESGHRVYLRDDVERLYRVLALRGVGIALDEIGAALGNGGVSLVDTVRRHVAAVERDIEQRRRLLDRLHGMLAALERSSDPTVADLLGAVEAMTVVEATIEDVVTRERWDAAWELMPPHVVLLKERDGERVLPIWIGQPEAAALVAQRRGVVLARPMGHDLMTALLGALEARVERVVIERLRGNTYFATVTVVSGGDPREIDARPSDALNLAVRAGAPIHVASDVFDSATHWPATCAVQAPPWIPADGQAVASRAPAYTIDERSPQMLRAAAAQARALGHDHVGPAHLLLGLLADADGPAARLLEVHQITLASASAAVAATPPDAHGVPPAADAIRLARGAMFVMQRASSEAQRRGTLDIGQLHLLLALALGSELDDVPALSAIGQMRHDVRAALDG